MLTSLRVDDWDELIPWEQVTLVSKRAPETRLQVRFHHAIAGPHGG